MYTYIYKFLSYGTKNNLKLTFNWYLLLSYLTCFFYWYDFEGGIVRDHNGIQNLLRVWHWFDRWSLLSTDRHFHQSWSYEFPVYYNDNVHFHARLKGLTDFFLNAQSSVWYLTHVGICELCYFLVYDYIFILLGWSTQEEMRWEGHIGCMWERRGAQRVLVGNLKERDNIEDLGVSGR